MEMLKFGKFAALALAMAVAVGCSSKGGDDSGEGSTAIDPNAGYGADTGAVDGSLSEEAALRAITTFYFEYDSSDLKPEAMRALDVHAKDLQAAVSFLKVTPTSVAPASTTWPSASVVPRPYSATWFCRAFPRLSWNWFPTAKSVLSPWVTTSSPGLRTVV